MAIISAKNYNSKDEFWKAVSDAVILHQSFYRVCYNCYKKGTHHDSYNE